MSEELIAELLSVIQKKFPLTKYPYAEIAQMISSDEDEVLKGGNVNFLI